MQVLKEYVQHHVREEENEFFPRVEKMDIDLDALGEEIASLKQDLLQAAGAPASGSTIRIVDVKARGQSRRRAA